MYVDLVEVLFDHEIATNELQLYFLGTLLIFKRILRPI